MIENYNKKDVCGRLSKVITIPGKYQLVAIIVNVVFIFQIVFGDSPSRMYQCPTQEYMLEDALRMTLVPFFGIL